MMKCAFLVELSWYNFEAVSRCCYTADLRILPGAEGIHPVEPQAAETGAAPSVAA